MDGAGELSGNFGGSRGIHLAVDGLPGRAAAQATEIAEGIWEYWRKQG